MGQAIAIALQDDHRARLVGTVGRGDDPQVLAEQADVLIDFSTPEALAANLQAARGAACAIVIGTTGLSPDHLARMCEAAAHVPVLQAANMSLGVNLLAHLVRQTAARLGRNWDIEILEMHHRHKRDAPSGTALLLGEAAAEGRGEPLPALREAPRDGPDSLRADGGIGFAVLRGGSVAGDHQVVFAGDGERLELGHRAESRAVFARGAIEAALWLSGRPAGRYGMTDVLGVA